MAGTGIFGMRIGVTSQNRLKIAAVEEAYSFMRPPPEVAGYAAESGVGEQPVGKETLLGARNRIEDVRGRVEGLDRIISIENGIFWEDGRWVDRAVVVICIPGLEKEFIRQSKGVAFPDRYVETAWDIGFDKITVGEVMAREGYISDPKDPHISISGVSRQAYIRDTLAELVNEVELGI